jgi:pimeloyl-ACP methyl ester carboxylesterase
VATAFGDNLRSWAADCGGLVHPDYEWHAFAKIWQTPGEGEAFMANQQAQPAEEAAAGLAQIMSISVDDALEMASGQDETMDGCILDLYRSATPNPHAHWGPFAPTSAPGLVIQATADPFADERLSREAAALLGADVAVLEASHFWPYENPDGAAELLTRFWKGLD